MTPTASDEDEHGAGGSEWADTAVAGLPGLRPTGVVVFTEMGPTAEIPVEGRGGRVAGLLRRGPATDRRAGAWEGRGQAVADRWLERARALVIWLLGR